MKKLLSIVISLILMFSMSVSAFAASNIYVELTNLPENHFIKTNIPFYGYDIHGNSYKLIVSDEFVVSYFFNDTFIDSIDLISMGIRYCYSTDSTVPNASLFYSDGSRLAYLSFFGNVVNFNGIDHYISNGNNSSDDENTTETIVVKEDRPFFTTPLEDFTVTEGLLLLLFVVTFLNNIFKQYVKGN